MRKLIFILIVINLFSCIEKNTSDPIEAYIYWSGDKPPKEMKVIHAKYWQSPHFTLEYRLFMELKSSKEWRKEFIKQNHLILSDNKEELRKNLPIWFKPSEKFQLYLMNDSLRSDSKYYIDTIDNHFFIFEEQL